MMEEVLYYVFTPLLYPWENTLTLNGWFFTNNAEGILPLRVCEHGESFFDVDCMGVKSA